MNSLQDRQATEWGDDKVHLLFGDMRTLDIPEKVDILVSELLGSFGDNELSPECLDGAMRFLKRKCAFPLSNSVMVVKWASSRGHIYPCVVYCISRADLILKAAHRSSRFKGRKGAGNAVCSHATSDQYHERRGRRN